MARRWRRGRPLLQLLREADHAAIPTPALEEEAHLVLNEPSPLPEPVASQLAAGSVITIFAASDTTPYDDVWTSGGGVAANAASGRFEAAAVTSHPTQNTQVLDHGAGLAVRYRPLGARKLIRFSAFTKYSYDWYLRSSGLAAETYGFFGILLESFDLQGRNGRMELKVGTYLWRDRTDWFSTDGDRADDEILPVGQSTIYFLSSQGRYYKVWVYCMVGAAASRSGGFGTSSFARAQLKALVPFVVFEE
jgi:hypothetical protein